MTTPIQERGVNNGNGDNGIVLLNTFVIWKKRYRVFYHSSMLVWEKNDTKTGMYNNNMHYSCEFLFNSLLIGRG